MSSENRFALFGIMLSRAAIAGEVLAEVGGHKQSRKDAATGRMDHG